MFNEGERNCLYSDVIPEIEISLQRMKETILSRMGLYGSALGKAIEKRIEYSIANTDFGEEIDIAVDTTVKELIRSYFSHGKGKEILNNAVNKVMNEIFNVKEEVLTNAKAQKE